MPPVQEIGVRRHYHLVHKAKKANKEVVMDETIHGTVMPVLELSLQPGESIISEVGEFSWMTDAVQIATNTGGGMAGAGLKGIVKRAVAGAAIMMSTYTAEGGVGAVSFAAKVPGHIIPIDVSPEAQYMVHRHGFMAATPGVQLDIGFQQSFRGGVFGGMGFILQKITGAARGCWPSISNPGRACGCTRGTSVSFRPRSPSRWSGCPAWPIATWATTVTTSPS